MALGHTISLHMDGQLQWHLRTTTCQQQSLIQQNILLSERLISKQVHQWWISLYRTHHDIWPNQRLDRGPC